MPRQLAIGRKLAVGRTLAVGRKPIGFIDDGKVHAVLDTNIVIYALEALFKKIGAAQIEKDSLEIISLVGKDIIVIAINGKLFAEYSKVAQRVIIENRASSSDVSYLINLIENKSVAVRMLVDPQRTSPHENDDILFDGLSTYYLISNNLSHVDPSKLIRPSSYQATMTPTNFLNELHNRGII